jgi:hypothetical protein
METFAAPVQLWAESRHDWIDPIFGIFDVGENAFSSGRRAVMSNWPKDGKPASFEELTEPVGKAIRFAYRLARQNKDKDIPWGGLPKGRHELATTLPIDQALSAENLDYSLNDQGRDALREILAIQAQLAFEQERRIAYADIDTYLKLIELKYGAHEYTKPIRAYFHREVP